MKIQCKIKRKAGSQVTMGEETYDFQPDETGRHVAEVDDQEHIDRLLSINTFTALEGDEPAAHVTPGQDYGYYQPKPAIKAETGTEIDQAREAYQDAFGRKAHHLAKSSTLWRQINERDES